MLDIKFIRENADAIKENCKNRNVDVDVDLLLNLDEERRGNLAKLEELRALKNKGSKGKPTPEDIEKMKMIGEEEKVAEEKQKQIEADYLNLMMAIPNMTHPDSPIGGEEDFKILHEVGEPTKFDFKPKDHEELMTSLDMIDFERGAKVAGSKFYYMKGDGVKLNRALTVYGINILEKHGYTLMETPEMVRAEILEGSGFNPRGEESQIYEIKDHDLNLIGTGEITALGYHADEILDLSKGPIKYAVISNCYRTEGGAYGKDNKGLYRVHQFAKLELFVYCKPEDSETLHQEILGMEKEIMDGLELPYRVIDIPTGDMGGPAYRKYDIEAWMPFKDGYGEVTSCSNCTDYQARRLNIRFKNDAGKNEFVHTLNGTAVVLSRFPVAVVENYQTKDGGVEVPNALLDLMGKGKIKK